MCSAGTGWRSYIKQREQNKSWRYLGQDVLQADFLILRTIDILNQKTFDCDCSLYYRMYSNISSLSLLETSSDPSLYTTTESTFRHVLWWVTWYPVKDSQSVEIKGKRLRTKLKWGKHTWESNKVDENSQERKPRLMLVQKFNHWIQVMMVEMSLKGHQRNGWDDTYKLL